LNVRFGVRNDEQVHRLIALVQLSAAAFLMVAPSSLSEISFCFLQDEKLKAALAAASASSAQAELLKEETSGLKLKLMNSDYDLVHAMEGKRLLSERVQDLERVLANYDEVALARVSANGDSTGFECQGLE
jgi:hypothetical protein